MAEISQITVGGIVYEIKDETAREVESKNDFKWNLVLDYKINDNNEYQPITLDNDTGEMTFEETSPILCLVVPNLVAGDTLETAYSKIPNEFLAADQRYTSNSSKYGGVTSVVSDGVNANVDISAFHFEYGSGVINRVWNGFHGVKHKGSFTTYAIKTKPYNTSPRLYMTLSDGSEIQLATHYRDDANHWLYHATDWEATIENGILRINKSVSYWAHKARTSVTESPTVTNTSVSRYVKSVGEGVTITGYRTNENTANWANSVFYANGSNIKVWEGA